MKRGWLTEEQLDIRFGNAKRTPRQIWWDEHRVFERYGQPYTQRDIHDSYTTDGFIHDRLNLPTEVRTKELPFGKCSTSYPPEVPDGGVIIEKRLADNHKGSFRFLIETEGANGPMYEIILTPEKLATYKVADTNRREEGKKPSPCYFIPLDQFSEVKDKVLV